MMTPVGRRPGNQDTREEILAAARTAFAERGFEGASIRQIAAAASVDPALVHHYFGTKEDLFRAATAIPVDPSLIVPHVFAEGPEAAPERLVRTFLGVWEDPETGPKMLSLIRSAFADETLAGLAREFFLSQIVPRVRPHLETRVPAEEVPTRLSLVASTLFGLATTRYVLRIGPVADLDAETVAGMAGPAVRHFMLGDLATPIGPPRGAGQG